MIIRSQNKKGIINFNNIDTIGIEPNCCGCDVVSYNGTQESYSKLGEYSTEEKAIKALDMICRAYEKFRGGNVYENSIFNIPQEEELELEYDESYDRE